jgi:hypothetical protein
MALAADQAGIQFRTLNASKGPAVRATRAQADRQLYKRAIRRMLETQPNLQLVSAGGGRSDSRRRARGRRGHPERHRISRARRGAHRRHLPRRQNPRRLGEATPAAARGDPPSSAWPRACASCRCASGA